MKQFMSETGARAAALAGIVFIFVGVVGFIRSHTPKPSPPPEPPPAAETTVAETPAPAPAPVYAAPPVHRDFAKRRGAPQRSAEVAAEPQAPSLEDQYGIQVRGVRMSMGQTYIDLRYRVLDAEKAARLANGKTSAYLVDRTSGAMLLMRKPPGEGAFPPTGNRLVKGRTYFALVTNPERMVKSGSEVVFHVDGAGSTKLVVQ